jgi:hypothetical protein
MADFEFDLDNVAVGPRVLVWGYVDAHEIEAACPAGWEVDWDTVPATLDSMRDGKRGLAHPLVAVAVEMSPRELTTDGQAVFQSLMDLGLILQDIDKMVMLKVFLESIDPKNKSLAQLHAEIVTFLARIEGIVDAADQRFGAGS